MVVDVELVGRDHRLLVLVHHARVTRQISWPRREPLNGVARQRAGDQGHECSRCHASSVHTIGFGRGARAAAHGACDGALHSTSATRTRRPRRAPAPWWPSSVRAPSLPRGRSPPRADAHDELHVRRQELPDRLVQPLVGDRGGLAVRVLEHVLLDRAPRDALRERRQRGDPALGIRRPGEPRGAVPRSRNVSARTRSSAKSTRTASPPRSPNKWLDEAIRKLLPTHMQLIMGIGTAEEIALAK